MKTERLELFQQMDCTLQVFTDTIRNCAAIDTLIYPLWTVKDIAAHITFWHESFAANLLALSQHNKPKPLRGKMSELNLRGVNELRHETVENVLERLIKANKTIQMHICNADIISIPYRVGSRNYSPEEHLLIVCNHIHKHNRDIILYFQKRQKPQS